MKHNLLTFYFYGLLRAIFTINNLAILLFRFLWGEYHVECRKISAIYAGCIW